MAYTSPSTAENQKESEKVYVNAPTNPLPKMAYILFFSFSSLLANIFLPKAVMVQKRNKMVKELQSADIIFTATATSLVAGLANRVKILPNS